MIIPKQGLLEIKKVLEQGPSSKTAIKTPHLFLLQDDIAIAVKLIDAQFSPYEQVIPKEHKKIITVDRLRFVDALRRAQLMSSETRGVKVAATREGITITSDNPAGSPTGAAQRAVTYRRGSAMRSEATTGSRGSFGVGCELHGDELNDDFSRFGAGAQRFEDRRHS